jgi:LPXTG-site transpeptidase (sortase) family protein
LAASALFLFGTEDMSKKFLLLNGVGICSLAVGLVLLVIIMRARAVNIISTLSHPAETAVQQIITQTQSTNSAPQSSITGMPTKLSVPSLGIDIAVIPGYYDVSSQTWTLTTNKAQFATPSTQPNDQSGNTFIYGHARTNIFGALPKIRAGAQAVVTTSNGHAFYYSLSQTRVVDPTDSNAVFGYTGKPILTLQTCVGLLYQSRELLTFNLERAV